MSSSESVSNSYRNAIVIGGSIAGLLAARILTDCREIFRNKLFRKDPIILPTPSRVRLPQSPPAWTKS
jgi:heterodisulfide reductase subunit A-like polyferredoxin